MEITGSRGDRLVRRPHRMTEKDGKVSAAKLIVKTKKQSVYCARRNDDLKLKNN